MAPRSAAVGTSSEREKKKANGAGHATEAGGKEGKGDSASFELPGTRFTLERGLQSDKPPVMGSNYTGPLGDNFANKPLLKRLNWLHVPLLVSTPLIALYGLWACERFYWQTLLFAALYYNFTGLGITAGYHRLWAHNSYTAHPILQWILMMAACGAVEGSCRWWSRGHRAHHRYVDTDKDPYSASKGFFYSHIGWMLVKQDNDRIGRVAIDDLSRDPLVRLQHKFYLPLALFMGFILPTIICGLGWGDWWGGYFLAGVLRLVCVHHSTFFVNSLAHYLGHATYTDNHTARNNAFTALLTLGEGNHNAHHEFPSDYRNGLEWYEYDPTKVLIWAASKVGLAWDLKTFPRNEIDKGVLQMKQKQLDREREKINWGPKDGQLPVWTAQEFRKRCIAELDKKEQGSRSYRTLIVIDGFALDVTSFLGDHPGGAGLLTSEHGCDVTAKFKGSYYKHSNAARNMQSMFRVAKVEGQILPPYGEAGKDNKQEDDDN